MGFVPIKTVRGKIQLVIDLIFTLTFGFVILIFLIVYFLLITLPMMIINWVLSYWSKD